MKDIEGIWQVEGRTIYELQQVGWSKGKPVLVNRWSAHVQGNGPGSASPDELDAIAQRMGRVPELEAENAKLRAAVEKALVFHNRYCDRVGAADGWARAVHEALRAALTAD